MAEATATETKPVISLRLPDNIASVVAEKAKEVELRPSRWVLKLVCDTLGMEMPKASRTRAPKYNTAEEREAARKASIAKRNERIKNALALSEAFDKFQKGEISLEELNAVATGKELVAA